MKNQTVLYLLTNQLEGRADIAALLFLNMKKFVIFIFALALLIASEYYLLTELFTQKRLPVIAGSFITVLLCIFVFLRFFKKSVSPS